MMGMKKLYVSILFLYLVAALGCAALREKVPVYKNDALNEVYYRDEGFAAELARIPGLNTPNSPYAAGLKELWADYRGGTFKGSFAAILATGNPEGRAYCAPLEALLWLYARKPAQARDVLGAWDLGQLLAAAWGDCTGSAWDEWEEIRARLSAPELVAYYTKKALRYIPEPKDGKNYLQSPYETLLMKGGDCEDFAALIVEALEFGGYFARLFTVDIYWHEKKLIESHTVACFRDGGKWYFIQGYDGKYLGGGITGPFDQSNAMADYIANSIGGVTYYYYIDTAVEFMKAFKALDRDRP
jgi:hypothetical protein